jgi:nucleoside-diphosphate-sugar epimerase
MRAVISGGAGFLGSYLCRSLLRRGDDVVCVDDWSTAAPENIAQHTAPPPRAPPTFYSGRNGSRPTTETAAQMGVTV